MRWNSKIYRNKGMLVEAPKRWPIGGGKQCPHCNSSTFDQAAFLTPGGVGRQKQEAKERPPWLLSDQAKALPTLVGVGRQKQVRFDLSR